MSIHFNTDNENLKRLQFRRYKFAIPLQIIIPLIYILLIHRFRNG